MKSHIPSRLYFLLLFAFFLSACVMKKTSVPVGIFPKEVPKIPAPDAASAKVPDGYKVEVFMKDLIWPTSIEFDDEENVYIAEAGYAYGDPFAPAQILRITPEGDITRYADQLSAPVIDLLWHKGKLYISHRGKISVVNANGKVDDLVTGLPSFGDHFNNQMSVGPDGKIYFGQGVATNSGVVGMDNVYPFVWVMLWPDVHDVPAKDIKLRRTSFVTPQPNNVLSRTGKLVNLGTDVSYAVMSIFSRNKEKSMLVKTRAFQPFGEHKRTIKGNVKASGTILRINADGTGLEVYAWGLRNPYGVMWGPDGKLYVADNAYDERGSRPIANAKDNIWIIKQDGWYGFPDYSSGIPVTDKQFRSERGPKPKFILKDHPPVEKPWMTRPENAAVTKFDFSTSDKFGFKGQMFLTEFGSGTPITGDPNAVNYMLIRINPETKEQIPFLSNKAPGPKGQEYAATAGPRHPVEAKFSNDGSTLYVVDIGVINFAIAAAGPFPQPVPGTGVIWRITKDGTKPSGPPANQSYFPPKTFGK